MEKQDFQFPMSNTVLIAFFGAVALVTGATMWSFRAGFFWTGMCLIAVAAPLALLYWWMLYVNPMSTRVSLLEDGLRLNAPPFYKAEAPYSSITRAFVGNLKEDKRLEPAESIRSMRFGKYRTGMFKMAAGQEMLMVSNKDRVVYLETPERSFILGPDRFDAFVTGLKERGVSVKD